MSFCLIAVLLPRSYSMRRTPTQNSPIQIHHLYYFLILRALTMRATSRLATLFTTFSFLILRFQNILGFFFSIYCFQPLSKPKDLVCRQSHHPKPYLCNSFYQKSLVLRNDYRLMCFHCCCYLITIKMNLPYLGHLLLFESVYHSHHL